MSTERIVFLNPENNVAIQRLDIVTNTGAWGWGACLVPCSVVMQEKGRIRVTKREGGVRVQVNPTQGHVALTRFGSTQAVPSLHPSLYVANWLPYYRGCSAMDTNSHAKRYE
jgi:hypothetical protein